MLKKIYYEILMYLRFFFVAAATAAFLCRLCRLRSLRGDYTVYIGQYIVNFIM